MLCSFYILNQARLIFEFLNHLCRDLITGLTLNPTESNMERSDACAIFSLHFTLTAKGLANYQEVV